MQGKANCKIISKSLSSSLMPLLSRYLIGGRSLTEARKIIGNLCADCICNGYKNQPSNYGFFLNTPNIPLDFKTDYIFSVLQEHLLLIFTSILFLSIC